MRGHGMGMMLPLPYSAPKHRRHNPIGGIVSAANRALSGHERIPAAVSFSMRSGLTCGPASALSLVSRHRAFLCHCIDVAILDTAGRAGTITAVADCRRLSWHATCEFALSACWAFPGECGYYRSMRDEL